MQRRNDQVSRGETRSIHGGNPMPRGTNDVLSPHPCDDERGEHGRGTAARTQENLTSIGPRAANCETDDGESETAI